MLIQTIGENRISQRLKRVVTILGKLGSQGPDLPALSGCRGWGLIQLPSGYEHDECPLLGGRLIPADRVAGAAGPSFDSRFKQVWSGPRCRTGRRHRDVVLDRRPRGLQQTRCGFVNSELPPRKVSCIANSNPPAAILAPPPAAPGFRPPEFPPVQVRRTAIPRPHRESPVERRHST
jgi:hypothetical protein